MSSDIVERLCQAHQTMPVPSLASLYSDAADEIVRLRAEVKGLTGERDFNERQLVAEVAKVERLRAAGDALADALERRLNRHQHDAIDAWQEASRG